MQNNATLKKYDNFGMKNSVELLSSKSNRDPIADLVVWSLFKTN